MRPVDLSIRGACAALVLCLWAAGAPAALALEPGVHVDPESPAAKEYALPLNQARETGSTASEATGTALFGAGIKPPRSGGGAGAGRARGGAPSGSSARPGASSPASAVALADTSAGGSGTPSADNSTLALIGGAVAVIVLGALGGTVLRRRRPPPVA
jgi:hypothetical protein